MKMHRTQDIPDPSEKSPDLPKALHRFILKACRRNPAERYQDVNQVLEDLQPLARTIAPGHQHQDSAKRKMTTLFLSCDDDHQQELNRLLEEFSLKNWVRV